MTGVAFDEGEGGVLQASVYVTAMAGGEVVETNHFEVSGSRFEVQGWGSRNLEP